MTTIKERIKEIAQSKSLSIRAFEEKCGLGRGNISNMASSGAIGSDKMTKIIDTFPDVDAYWLLTGRANHKEFNTRITNEPEQIESAIIEKLTEKIAKQAEEIGSLKERLRQLEAKLGKKNGTSDVLGDFLEEVTSAQCGAEKVGWYI